MSAFPMLLPTSIMTLDGFRDWSRSSECPDDIRAAFLDTVVFLESRNEEPETHVKVKGEIFFGLATVFKEIDHGELYPSGVFLTNDKSNLASKPDGVFVTWAAFDEGNVSLVPVTGTVDRYDEMRGTPSWVLEVVSDSSVDKDTRRLRELYHRASIPEYWLVDARGEEIDFTILLWRKRGYVSAPLRNGWQKSSVFGREFRLTRKRGRRNLWRYKLEVR